MRDIDKVSMQSLVVAQQELRVFSMNLGENKLVLV